MSNLCEFIRIGKSSYLVCKKCDQFYKTDYDPDKVYVLCGLHSGHCEYPIGPTLSLTDITSGSVAIDCVIQVNNSGIDQLDGEWHVRSGHAYREGISLNVIQNKAGYLAMVEVASGAAIWLGTVGSPVLKCTDASDSLLCLVGHEIRLIDDSFVTQPTQWNNDIGDRIGS